MAILTLRSVAELTGGTLAAGSHDIIQCSSLTASSAQIAPGGALFIAVRGFAADGHSFVNDAFMKGAVAAVVEDAAALAGQPGVVVANTRLALSRLAAAFYDYPATKLQVVGITGTNGKTTTNWIVYHLLNAIGGGCQRIGTLGSECMGRATEGGTLTSPDPISLHRLLGDAVKMGARSCVVEASSHALDQARVEDLEFDVGVFTNLTRDHLDYHKTFDNYFAAKRQLFTLVAGGSKGAKGAVINGDDEYGRRLIRELPALGLNDWSFGSTNEVALQILTIEERGEGMEIVINDTREGRPVVVHAPFIGRHNAENVVAAYGACRALGYSVESIVTALASIPQVPGRLERVGRGGPRVFVDYAHTPDALMRAIEALRPTTTGKLWVVFGCGGDRDKGKRPQMGEIASRYGDVVVVTSDNPRTEEPEAIVKDILVGVPAPGIIEVDRRKAIQEAISRAAASDTILIAGKGHEDYQIIGTEKIHFSDQQVALESFAATAS